jgi:hypothetical protein
MVSRVFLVYEAFFLAEACGLPVFRLRKNNFLQQRENLVCVWRQYP